MKQYKSNRCVDFTQLLKDYYLSPLDICKEIFNKLGEKIRYLSFAQKFAFITAIMDSDIRNDTKHKELVLCLQKIWNKNLTVEFSQRSTQDQLTIQQLTQYLDLQYKNAVQKAYVNKTDKTITLMYKVDSNLYICETSYYLPSIPEEIEPSKVCSDGELTSIELQGVSTDMGYNYT